MGESTETAILAGGCFWILQRLLDDREGVVATRVGFTDGENEDPTEEDNVGHAEAVEVVFDPARLSYRELLEHFFLVHRPDLGEDAVGFGYRSAIFVFDEEQRRIAAATIADVDASGHWPAAVAIEVVQAGPFWPAPAADQGFLGRYQGKLATPFAP